MQGCVRKVCGSAAGFAPSDAIAAGGKTVLESDKAETDLAGFVMQAISRFFATEQVFADHDLEDACQGTGFPAVNAAWALIEPDGPLDALLFGPRDRTSGG